MNLRLAATNTATSSTPNASSGPGNGEKTGGFLAVLATAMSSNTASHVDASKTAATTATLTEEQKLVIDWESRQRGTFMAETIGGLWEKQGFDPATDAAYLKKVQETIDRADRRVALGRDLHTVKPWLVASVAVAAQTSTAPASEPEKFLAWQSQQRSPILARTLGDQWREQGFDPSANAAYMQKVQETIDRETRRVAMGRAIDTVKPWCV